MSEYSRDRKEREYGDRMEHEERENDRYEATYRDGSLKNECWRTDEKRGSDDRKREDDR